MLVAFLLAAVSPAKHPDPVEPQPASRGTCVTLPVSVKGLASANSASSLPDDRKAMLIAAIDAVARFDPNQHIEVFLEEISFTGHGRDVPAIVGLVDALRTDGAVPELSQLDLRFDAAAALFTTNVEGPGATSSPLLPESEMLVLTLVVSADADGWARQYAFDPDGELSVGTAAQFAAFNALYDPGNRQLSVLTPFSRLQIYTFERLCQPAPYGALEFADARESLLRRAYVENDAADDMAVYRIPRETADEPVPFHLGGRIGVSDLTGAIEYMRLPSDPVALPAHVSRLQVDPETGTPLRGFCAVVDPNATKVTRWTIVDSARLGDARTLEVPAGTAVFDFRSTENRFVGNVENLPPGELARELKAGRPSASVRAADPRSAGLSTGAPLVGARTGGLDSPNSNEGSHWRLYLAAAVIGVAAIVALRSRSVARANLEQ
ncbi:MAG: hypothetical protein AAFU73_02835 [Planctomycetota bacterium]